MFASRLVNVLLCLLFVHACVHGWVLEFPDQVDDKVNLSKINHNQLVEQHLQRSTQLQKRIAYNLAEKKRSNQSDDSISGSIVHNGNPNNRGGAAAATPRKPQLLVLAFDGFRYDYPSFFKTPNLDR